MVSTRSTSPDQDGAQLAPSSSSKKDGGEGENKEGMTKSSSRSSGMSVSQLLSLGGKETSNEVYHKSVPASSMSKSPTEVEETGDAARSCCSGTSSGNVKQNVESTALNEAVAAYQYTAMQQVTENRENIEYKLTIREQPKHSRMCGVGEKADRRPIDPAPIIQLRVITHDHGPPTKQDQEKEHEVDKDDDVRPLTQKSPIVPSNNKGGGAVSATSSPVAGKVIRRGVPVQTTWGEGWEDKTWYLENPYYFMYAMLADAETDEELHLLQDGKTRYTTGSCVSCLYHLKDIDGSEQGFFVFPDLSIRVEGRYRLKLCLFETIGHEVHHCKSVYSTPFSVYTAKRFPGMEESTLLSKSFADQGLKVRVRKNPRARRGRFGGKRKDAMESDEESIEDREKERMAMTEMARGGGEGIQSSIKRVKSNEQEYMRQTYEHPAPPSQMSQLQRRPEEQSAYSHQPFNHRERRYTAEGIPDRGGPPPFSRPPSGVMQTPASEMASRRGHELSPPHRLHQSGRMPVDPRADPRVTVPPSMSSHQSRLDPAHHPPHYHQHQQQQQEGGYPDDRYPPHYPNNSHSAYQERAPPALLHQERGGYSDRGGSHGRMMGYEQPPGPPRLHYTSTSSREYQQPVMRAVTSNREDHYRRPLSPPPPLPRSNSISKQHRMDVDDARTNLPPLHVALSPRQSHSPAAPPPLGYHDVRSRPPPVPLNDHPFTHSRAPPPHSRHMPLPSRHSPPPIQHRREERRH